MRKEIANLITDALNAASLALIERDKLVNQLSEINTDEAREAAADAGIVWILEPTYTTENGVTTITNLAVACKQARRVKGYPGKVLNPVVEYRSRLAEVTTASDFFPSEEAANLSKAIEELDARHEREVCRAYMQIRSLPAGDLKALAVYIHAGHYSHKLPTQTDPIEAFIAQCDAKEAP